MFHERCFLDDITVKGIDGSGNQVELKKVHNMQFLNRPV